MARKAESTMAMLMAMQPSHHLLYVKSRIMKKTLDNPELFQKKTIDDKELDLLTKELVRIEIIATAVHYAEVFASKLIAMKRYKWFHKFLLEYKPSEIIKFYKDISKRRNNYVANLLQYPQVSLVQPEDSKKEIKESVQQIHSEINKLAKFYLKWHDFYNSYKHGFRVFASKPNPDDDFTLAGYITDPKSLNSFRIQMTSEHVEEALDYCEFMFRILSNAEDVFVQRKIEKKDKMKMTIFTKNKKGKK